MEASQPNAGDQLTRGFSDFMAASARLELAYCELQGKVATLNLRLQEQAEALRDSESDKRNQAELLRELVEAMPCGVLLRNANGTAQLVNPEAARLLALVSAQLPSTQIALPWLRADHPLEPSQATEIQDSLEQEVHFESATGRHWISVRQISVATSAAAYPSGLSSAVILEDITARKLQEGRREAERSTAALAQIAALLAHEIRNPLASLELFAGLLEDSPDRQREWLSHLRAGIRSLSGTVNNVLTLHGEALPALEPVNLASEVGSAVRFLQPLAAQSGAALLFRSEEDELWVRANRSAVHQLVLNLVTNALRHTRQGEVRVCTYQHSPSAIHLAVMDSGSGIQPQDLPRLFESGYSASGTRPGLGLAVCQRLMSHQGGSIAVESQPGKGSTFTLEFQPA